MKPDDIRRFFEQFLKHALPGAKLESLKLSPENMLDVSKEIKAEIAYSVDGMTATGRGKSMVSVPWIGNGVGLINQILDGTGLDKRKYPMRTRVACGLDEQVSLKLGDGFAAAQSLPVCPPVDDGSMSYEQQFTVKDGTLDCSRDLKLHTVEVSPVQYPALKKTLKELEYDARKSVVLDVANPPPADTDVAADPPPAPPVGSNSIVVSSQKTSM